MVEKIVFCGKEIPVHSIVDVITNSSSTVFVWPKKTAVSLAKELVQDMMTALGVKGVPENYFNISFEIDPVWLNDRMEDAKWEYEDNPVGYEKKVAHLRSLTIDSPEIQEGEMTTEGQWVPSIVLRLSPKNCDSLNISSKMLGLFDVGEISC